MPYTYKISAAGAHVEIVGTGEITTTDCLDMIKMIFADPYCSAASTTLIDLSGATYKARDRSEVVQIAEALESNLSLFDNNIAIVAQRSTLFHAELLSRHVREATEVRIKVFVDRSAAEAFCRDSSQVQMSPCVA